MKNTKKKKEKRRKEGKHKIDRKESENEEKT